MARSRSPGRRADGKIDYRALGDLRYHIRRFVRVREVAARAAGVEPRQYLLLLQVKALEGRQPPTVTVLAERLQITHHAVVQLVDRLARRNMVRRQRGDGDRRHVVIALRPRGETVLRRLARYSVAELDTEAAALMGALKRLITPS